MNVNHSWFESVDEKVVYIMMEVRQETDYVRHHIQKVVAFFYAMREFADQLVSKGHHVIYLKLDDDKNRQSISSNLEWIIDEYGITRFSYQEPDEFRLDKLLCELCDQLKIDSCQVSTEHFFTRRSFLKDFFKGKKTYLMESFYRELRRKTGILMDGSGPVSGRWNYDAENRKKLPRGHKLPYPKVFAKNIKNLVDLIKAEGVRTIGAIDEDNFIWPVNRLESLDLLEFFCSECLPRFGTYQDALSQDAWSLYHSRLSFSMNAKLISPKEVIERVLEEWGSRSEEITLSQVEGFIRQILGWREYMRGVYWAHMPEYSSLNFFNHKRKLPDFFWTGETKMKCVKHAIDQSLQYSYAHHIQRLMVTGNFALLAGVDPDELDEWYLGIYIDAIEWVEITNTRGMSQFADGGIVGTKPYVSSANYINKMSDYCKGCYYDPKKRTGPNACPFNSLYWNFYEVNRHLLAKNPRIGMAYRLLDKMESDKKTAILDQAQTYLSNLDQL